MYMPYKVQHLEKGVHKKGNLSTMHAIAKKFKKPQNLLENSTESIKQSLGTLNLHEADRKRKG